MVITGACNGKVEETAKTVERLARRCPGVARVPVLTRGVTVMSEIVILLLLFLVPLLFGTLEWFALDETLAKRLPLVENLMVWSKVDGVLEKLNDRCVLKLVDGVLDPVWVDKVHVTIDPRRILPVGWKTCQCDIHKVLLHPQD